MMHAMTDDSARHHGVGTNQPLTERLQRLAWLLRNLPASSVATFVVLSVVEQEPHPGMAICAAAQPVASLVADTDGAINVPLLHRLVDEGMLAIWHEGPPPGRKGRLYALTAQGACRLAELRCSVREAGQWALTAAAADLDALAGWTQESFAGSKASSDPDRPIMDEGAKHIVPVDAVTGRTTS
jgi:DNA-binding PadR family transcriptional regulator